LSVPEDRYPQLALSPQRLRQKTLESIVAILLELAEREPVLFILEDLHWTDPTTLEFLGLLVEQVPAAAIYNLLTCRPHFQPAWHHRSYLTEITVNRLSREQIERVVGHVAGGKKLPEQVLSQIVEKTDGVPLFVEEMTKTVLESGVLKATNEQYELAGALTTLAIPATLQDSLMARLDRLVTAKGVAQMGATIGRQFSYALLHAVTQIDELTLQRELGRLVDAELLYQRRLPPHATYTFKHALIQDVAYQSLLRSTRQQYHQRITQVLEEQFPETVETQPELLAYHCTESGIHEQAVGYWHKAGEQAIQRSANVEAIALIRQGLEQLKTLPDTSERAMQELTLQRTLGVPLLATKGWAAPEVGQVYSRARDLCQIIGDVQQLYSVLVGLWGFYLVSGELQTAQALAEQQLTIAQRQQDSALLLQGYFALGNTLHTRGELIPARTTLEHGIALYDPQQHRDLAFRYGQDPGTCCLGYAACTLWLLGYPEQARRRSQEMLTHAQALSHTFSIAFAQNLALRLHRFLREWQTVLEQAGVLMTLVSEQGYAQLVAACVRDQGMALAAQGQVAKGLTMFRQGLMDYRATGAVYYVPLFLVWLADICGQAGEVEEGLLALTEALTVIETTGERVAEAELYRLNGELLLQQSPDNATEAEACFHQALSIAQSQQAKSWELRAATSLARLWQSQGKRDKARELLGPVYNWFTEGFDTADLIDAKTLLDELA
jgi:predicted ATPase